MTDKDTPLFVYRIYASHQAFKILSEYPTVEKLWDEIITVKHNDGFMKFKYPRKGGNHEFVTLMLQADSIVGVDDPWGTAPMDLTSKPVDKTTKTKFYPSRIQIGQDTKNPRIGQGPYRNTGE